MPNKELKQAVAFLFQRRGVTEMKADDFIYDPATELGWFGLPEAKELLEVAKERGLVKESGGMVSVDFDHRTVEFPVGFKPSRNILEAEKKQPLFPSMLSEALDSGRVSRGELMAAVNQKQDDMNLEIEVALIMVCDERGIELAGRDRFIGAIRKKIRGERNDKV